MFSERTAPMSAEEARPARSELPENSSARSASGTSERTPAASAVCLTRRATCLSEPLDVDSLVVLEDAAEQQASGDPAEADPFSRAATGQVWSEVAAADLEPSRFAAQRHQHALVRRNLDPAGAAAVVPIEMVVEDDVEPSALRGPSGEHVSV